MYPSIFVKQSAKNALTATKVQKKKTKNTALEKSKATKLKPARSRQRGKTQGDKLTPEKAQGDKAQSQWNAEPNKDKSIQYEAGET